MPIERLKRGTVDLVSPEELGRKLALGRPLRVKLGVDPTSPDLHLGHTVVLQKLRAFQDLGHTAVLIIGDFTARVGDPSGRDSTRPVLGEEQISANARTYQDQAFKVLLRERAEVRFNSEWLDPFVKGGELLRTLSRHTVGQLLEREDFQARLKAGSPITLLETLYPLLQGYDSVAVNADVELGGTDQLFNLLKGRQMQKDAGQEPQVVLTVPLLVGLDGQKKMSKSYGNHIALNDPPRELFGKAMRVSDELMRSYYELLTGEDPAAVKALHPMEAKKRLAALLTARYHGEDAARAEREFFERTFSKRETPADVPVVELKDGCEGSWSQILVRISAVKSRKEAQRLIGQGAFSVDGEKVLEDAVPPAGLYDLKVGKHKFYRLRFR